MNIISKYTNQKIFRSTERFDGKRKSRQYNFRTNFSRNAEKNRNKSRFYTAAAETFAEIMWRKSDISDLMRTRRMLVRVESRRILSDSFEVDVSARGRGKGDEGGWSAFARGALRIALASAFVRSSR